mgnify:CR=1 FL=1
MCANIDFAPPCLLKIMGNKIYWGRGVNFMMQNWKHELEELLYHLGIYLSQDGYPVICAAADLVLQEPERLRRLMTGVYLEVAKRCGCTAASVERSLRTTVATAWEANPTLFQKMAMREITQPPTAGDFLCMVRHYLQQVCGELS